MNIRHLSLIWLFSTLLLLQGCGYHNPYTRTSGQDQSDATVHMSVWNNRTNEIGLENLIFQKTADWLRQIGSLQITSDPDQAAYLLSGTVLKVSYPATAFNPTSTATTLMARIMVEYKLTDRASGKTIWQTTDTAREQSYPVGKDALFSQSNKNMALEIIAEEIGEHIYLKITDTLTSTGGSEQLSVPDQ